jgi:hypothetical protein
LFKERRHLPVCESVVHTARVSRPDGAENVKTQCKYPPNSQCVNALNVEFLSSCKVWARVDTASDRASVKLAGTPVFKSNAPSEITGPPSISRGPPEFSRT